MVGVGALVLGVGGDGVEGGAVAGGMVDGGPAVVPEGASGWVTSGGGPVVTAGASVPAGESAASPPPQAVATKPSMRATAATRMVRFCIAAGYRAIGIPGPGFPLLAWRTAVLFLYAYAYRVPGLRFSRGTRWDIA